MPGQKDFSQYNHITIQQYYRTRNKYYRGYNRKNEFGKHFFNEQMARR